MSLRLTLACCVLLTACSSDVVLAPPASRLVVLQYAADPTPSDSLAVSAAGGAAATVYHFLNAVGVVTADPLSAFAALRSRPDSITDTNSLECNGLTVRVVTTSVPTAADSAYLGAQGVRPLMYRGKLFGMATTATLDPIGNLQPTENIVGGHLQFNCVRAL